MPMSNAASFWFGEVRALRCPCSFYKAVIFHSLLALVTIKCIVSFSSALQDVCSKEYLALLACPHLVPP